MKPLNARVIYYRKMADKTQQEVADFLGIKVSTYSQREREGNLTVECVLKICECLKVHPLILICGEIPEIPVKIIEKEPDFTHQEKNMIECMRFMNQKQRDYLYKHAVQIVRREIKPNYN